MVTTTKVIEGSNNDARFLASASGTLNQNMSDREQIIMHQYIPENTTDFETCKNTEIGTAWDQSTLV